VKQYVGPGHIYYLQDKHKSSICRLFVPNHCRELVNHLVGQIVSRESSWIASSPCPCFDVHILNLPDCVYSLWSSCMWFYFSYIHYTNNTME